MSDEWTPKPRRGAVLEERFTLERFTFVGPHPYGYTLRDSTGRDLFYGSLGSFVGHDNLEAKGAGILGRHGFACESRAGKERSDG